MSRDPEGKAEDRLLEAADDAKVRVPDEGIEAVLRRVAEPSDDEARTPTEAFLRDLRSGRVQKAMWVCDHANQIPSRLLLRARGAWLLGCESCVSAQLRLRGEDRRCDWCGVWSPSIEMGKWMELEMRTVRVVARFCRTHRQMIEGEREESNR